MSITYSAPGSGQATLSTGYFSGMTAFIRQQWDALQERRRRARVRAELRGLKDWELIDIGIGRGEIDYVASNPDTDPRGIRSGE